MAQYTMISSTAFMREKTIYIILACFLVLFQPLSALALTEYFLGPGDKLSIRLNDLRSGTGEAYQWSAFNGEFSVDPSGKISLPIIGETTAAGLSVNQLSSYIAEHVQSKVGLAKTPTASVQVIKFRPFYIMGVVEKPGEYEFRPGLTVIQAVSIAGGFARSSDALAMGLRKESLTYRGDVKSLELERDHLVVKRARLEAEFAGAESFALPANSSSDQASMQNEEQRLLNERRRADKEFLALNKRFGLKITEELQALDSKETAVTRQIDAAKRELASVNDLVNRGLAVTPRQTALEQTVAAYESTRVDVQLARVRSQQEISRNEKDLLDYTSRRKAELINDIVSTKDRLGALERKINSSQSLLNSSESNRVNIFSLMNASKISYVITRKSGADLKKITADEGTAVDPDDVIHAYSDQHVQSFSEDK